jgi:hypothetical protein
MARHALVMVALAVALTGCATTSIEPSASPAEAMSSFAGHWQGTIWETASVFYQGQTLLDIQVSDDATWTGTIGTASASGTAAMRGSWLVLSGTATGLDHHKTPIFYELKGDASRRWGEITSTFSGRDGGGRDEHATVSLRKTS